MKANESLSQKTLIFLDMIRVKQYLKNLFVFAPAFFAFKIFDPLVMFRVFLAFVFFSITASSVYILNDIRDRHSDKSHPVKKNRPITAGKVELSTAMFTCVMFFFIGMVGAAMLSLQMLIMLLFYVFINILYTYRLKHMPIVDVFIIALGFVIRIYSGGYVAMVALSQWIILVTFLFALFLALAKRRDDVLIYMSSGKKPRKNIDQYNLDFLNSTINIMASVVIVAYIMYCVSPEVEIKLGTSKLYLTVAFVIFGIFRYLQLIFVKNETGVPEEILLKDRYIQFSIAGWLAFFAFLVYFENIKEFLYHVTGA